VHQPKERANLNPAAASLPRITPAGEQNPAASAAKIHRIKQKMAPRIAKENPRRTVPE
jgi:hypothetical protein